jgi:hypothetical protein
MALGPDGDYEAKVALTVSGKRTRGRGVGAERMRVGAMQRIATMAVAASCVIHWLHWLPDQSCLAPNGVLRFFQV